MAGQTTLRRIDPAVLAGLATLELAARTAVEGAMIGIHRSPLFGTSQEFAEYRPYEPGDDLRLVDWNVYARLDRTYIKRFFGDTNTQLMVLLDVSASMGFGTTTGHPGDDAGGAISKLDYGRLLAAALVYLGARQHDAVGVLAFAGDMREYRPPAVRGPAHGAKARELYHMLDRLEAGGATDLELPFGWLRARLKRRGIVVVISDFFVEPEKLAPMLQPLASRGHDLLLAHVVHPEERAPALTGGVELADMETGTTLAPDLDDLRHHYPARFKAHGDALRGAAAAIGADYLCMDTDVPLDRALRGYLQFRGRRS